MQPTKIDAYSQFDGGISDYDKGADYNEYAFGRSVNYRNNPREITLLPKTTKESGSIITDFIKDGDRVGTDLWYYGDAGNIYKRTSIGSHSNQRTVSASHGNGMKYYTEDRYLYYTSDKLIGRYGQIGGTPTFSDDFLGSEGGVPLNTHWVDFEASSSMYASAADHASTSITSDLAIECTIKPESLPAVGSSMVLASKWDINSNKRSYKFEIYAVSGYFGDGTDGALTISSNTTEAPIDSACTGTSGSISLSATNASFATNQIILIHQTQGTGAGTQQRNTIVGYTAGTITLGTALNADYTTGAQVRVLKQYTDVTINSGITYTAKAWDGTVGGILAFIANGTVTSTGSINATGKGFRGGSVVSGGDPQQSYQGESELGVGTPSTAANGTGGGGGYKTNTSGGIGGGGGGHGTVGATAVNNASSIGGVGGTTSGTADLTTLKFGGGGGAACGNSSEAGTAGGGIIFIAGATITVTGSVVASGASGANQSVGNGSGGCGAGGAILLKGQTVTLGSSLVTAAGGTAGTTSGDATSGGNGGTGRIHLDYYTSYTGTTTPTLDVTQDNTLVTNTTYQLRLGLSSNGTAEEFLTKASTITAGTTVHVGVSWDASASTATFAQDGVSLGSSVGAVTSLNDNASVFGVAADFNSTARNFYDGRMDELRVWNTERTVAQFFNNKDIQIPTNSAGLAVYYKFNNTYDDATANAQTLTAANTPVFFTDVPFSSPTSRLDLDQSLDTTGNTFALATSISEAGTGRQTFVPNRDPQKSIEVNVDDTGDDSDWTLTVHDSQNRTVASKTITHANLHTGDMEFVFDTVWRPIRGASYHFHITATTTTGAPKVVTTTSNDLETADFHTYYQFLVEDVDYHPIEQMLNFLAIGNDRYVATYAADSGYDPHRVVLPSGWRVRCFAVWKGLLAIGCWKGTNIYDTDEGMIFLWDGYSPTYIDAIPVPEGGINAMLSSRGILTIMAGYHGDMLEYRGGDYAEFVKRVPKIVQADYMETLPKALTMWDGLLRWGVGGVSSSSNVERGVYTWGRRKSSNPNSLSYDYPISTGSRASTNVKIGFMYAIDRKLCIGWKDNVSYGMDVVDPTGDCFATGTIEKDIKDYGRVSKEKTALLVRADFKPLATGQSIKLKYRLNRASAWIEGATSAEKGLASTVGDTFARLNVPFGNNREVEFAADLITSSGVTPTLLELAHELDPKTTERAI